MPDLLPIAWTVVQVLAGFTAAYLLLIVCVELLVWWFEWRGSL